MFQDLTPILHNLIQKIEEVGTRPSSFCEATLTLVPKPKTVQKENGEREGGGEEGRREGGERGREGERRREGNYQLLLSNISHKYTFYSLLSCYTMKRYFTEEDA